MSPLPVLCYHRVGGPLELGVTRVGRAVFARQMTALARAADELSRARQALVQRLGASAGRAVAYPFGAADARVQRLARSAGYELGFAGVRGNGGAMNVPRVPVYVLDAGSVPLGLRADGLGSVGWFVADLANRCAVGTSWMMRMRRRPSAFSHQLVEKRSADG